MENRFKTSLLDPATLSVTWELVPGRGAREKDQEKALTAAQQAAKGGKVHALTITDNPGGNPAILADYLGEEILKMGIEPLVHFTCKDKNRNQIESELYALDRAGVRNLLVMSGDYPVTGFQGRPKPVFDLDPVQAVELIQRMNHGLEYPGLKGTIKHQPSDFFAGVAVSPFKATEAEQMVQYFKLKKKIAAGAGFVVTQLGYDARKFHEALQFVKQIAPEMPVVGNIYVLPFGAGKVMNQNKIPGCVVTDKLIAELDGERSAADKGEGARLLRAARMYAIMKGMGFSGVHIGGHNLRYEQVEHVIGEGEALSPNWRDLVHHFDYPQPRGFYYFEKDSKTGLNTDTPTRRTGIAARCPGRSLLPDVPALPSADVRAGEEPLRPHGRGQPDGRRIKAGRRIPQAGAPGKGPPLRLPRLRRLRPDRCGLQLSHVPLSEESAERGLRGEFQRLVRGLSGQEAVHLCDRLCEAETLR